MLNSSSADTPISAAFSCASCRMNLRWREASIDEMPGAAGIPPKAMNRWQNSKWLMGAELPSQRHSTLLT
jgi:hypothetical protein